MINEDDEDDDVVVDDGDVSAPFAMDVMVVDVGDDVVAC
jgi:hypothetical protein